MAPTRREETPPASKTGHPLVPKTPNRIAKPYNDPRNRTRKGDTATNGTGLGVLSFENFKRRLEISRKFPNRGPGNIEQPFRSDRSQSVFSESAAELLIGAASPMLLDDSQFEEVRKHSRRRKGRSEASNEDTSGLVNDLFPLCVKASKSQPPNVRMTSEPPTPEKLPVFASPSSGLEDIHEEKSDDGEYRILSIKHIANNRLQPTQRKFHSSIAPKPNATKGRSALSNAAGNTSQPHYGKLMDNEVAVLPADDARNERFNLEERRARSKEKNRSGKSSQAGVLRQQSQMRIPGGPKPRNTLGGTLEVSLPLKRHSSTVQSDHHIIDQGSWKRQKRNPQSTRAARPDVINLEDDEGNASNSKDRRRSFTASGNGQTSLLKHDSLTGEQSVFKSVDKSVSTYEKQSRNRHNRARGQGAVNGAVVGSDQFIKKSFVSKDDGEDPDDRISEDELAQSTKRRKKLVIEIESSAYTGTTDLRPPRQNGHIMERFRRQSPAHESGLTSHHFSKSRTDRTDAPFKSRTVNGMYTQTGISTDSVDELSIDHFAKVEIHSGQNQKGHTLELAQQIPGVGRSASVENGVQYQNVDEDSSADEASEQQASITPSTIEIVKRPRKRYGEEQFAIVGVFSDQAVWLNADSRSSWTLTCDTSNLLALYDNSGREIWSLIVNNVHKAESDKLDNKLILHLPRLSIGGTLYIQFGSVQERAAFEKMITGRNVTRVLRQKEGLGRVFDNQYEKLQQSLEMKLLRPKSDDIELYESNQKRRLDQMFNEAQAQKNPPQGDLPLQEQRGKPQRIAKSMLPSKGDIIELAQTTKKRPAADEALAPDTFYGGLSNDTTQELRSRSTRTKKKPEYRSLSPEQTPVERWTDKHPNWTEHYEWSSKASLVYPQIGAKKTTVDRQDIERLDEGEFLNDNLIAFYLRYLEKELQEHNPKFAKRVYFQNTFFYDRLVKNPPRGEKINYEAVQRWTAKVDLTDYDYIIVPVNELQHWYVAIIYKAKALLDPPSDVAEVDDTNPSEFKKQEEVIEAVVLPEDSPVDPGPGKQGSARSSPSAKNEDRTSLVIDLDGDAEAPIGSNLLEQGAPKRSSKGKKLKKKSAPPVRKYDPELPRIVILDSLGVRHNSTAMNLRAYLAAEIGFRHDKEIDASPAKLHTAQGIPKQDNYCDCGLYVLLYMERLLASNGDFIQKILQGVSQENLDWKEAPDLRNHIRNMLFDLQKEQAVSIEEARQDKLKRKAAERRMKEECSSPAGVATPRTAVSKNEARSSPRKAKDTSRHASPIQDNNIGSKQSRSSSSPQALDQVKERGRPRQDTKYEVASPNQSKARLKQPENIKIDDSRDSTMMDDRRSAITFVASSSAADDFRSKQLLNSDGSASEPVTSLPAPQYPGLREFGNSFDASKSQPRDTEHSDAASSSSPTAPENVAVVNTPSSQINRSHRKMKSNEVVTINGSPDQSKVPRALRSSIEQEIINGTISRAVSGCGFVDTDPVDQLVPADEQQTTLQTDARSADTAEMLLQTNEPVVVARRHRSGASPDLAMADKKRTFIDLEDGDQTAHSSVKRRKKSISELGQTEASSRKSRTISASPIRSREKKQDVNSGKATFSNNLEKVMMNLPKHEHNGLRKTVPGLKPVNRKHTHFDDDGK